MMRINMGEDIFHRFVQRTFVEIIGKQDLRL